MLFFILLNKIDFFFIIIIEKNTIMENTLKKKFTAAEINDMILQKVKVTLLLDNSNSMDNKVPSKNNIMVPFKKVFVEAVNKFFQNLIDTGCQFEYDIVTFNTSIDYLHRNKLSTEFNSIDNEYETKGWTSFYDSVGEVIKNLEKDNIINILLIVTDGEDNSSTVMTSYTLKTLIDDVEKNNNCKVILLGTEIDTYGLGQKIGLSKQNSVGFEKTEEGICNIMSDVSYSVGRCITGEIDIKDLEIKK